MDNAGRGREGLGGLEHATIKIASRVRSARVTQFSTNERTTVTGSRTDNWKQKPGITRTLKSAREQSQESMSKYLDAQAAVQREGVSQERNS